MKKLFTLLFAFILFQAGFAQKSSNTALTMSLVVNPPLTLQPTIKTYSTLVLTPVDPLYGSERKSIEKNAKEKGADPILAVENARAERMKAWEAQYLKSNLKKVEGNGDLSIVLKTTRLKVANEATVPVSDLRFQDVVFSFSVSVTLQLLDKSGNLLHTEALLDSTTEIKYYKANLPLFLKKKNLSEITALQWREPAILERIFQLAGEALPEILEVQQPAFILGIFSVKGKPFAPLNDVQKSVLEAYGKFHALSQKNRITKEEMGKVLTDAQVVWEKFMTEKKSEMEERAYKGLVLNCAFACAWRNELDNANTWLGKLSAADLVQPEAMEDEAPDDQPPMGAVITLPFEQYAANLQKLINTLKRNGNRAEIVQ